MGVGWGGIRILPETLRTEWLGGNGDEIQTELLQPILLDASHRLGEILLGKSPRRRCHAGIILCMHPTTERWSSTVMPSLFGWVHNQNDPWILDTLCLCYIMFCFLPNSFKRQPLASPWFQRMIYYIPLLSVKHYSVESILEYIHSPV